MKDLIYLLFCDEYKLYSMILNILGRKLYQLSLLYYVTYRNRNRNRKIIKTMLLLASY